MTYVPAVPLSGVAGLRFLERTDAIQRSALENSSSVKRDIAYFNENFKNVETAEDLLGDRRLLTVALGAFGLGEEINKTAFLKKILEEGGTQSDAFANKLVDRRYRNFASAFDFDQPAILRTNPTKLAEEISSKYLDQTYEIAIGDQDTSLRLALNFKRNAPEVAEQGWFAMMGDSAIREVIQSALGLPEDVAKIDIDQQREIFSDRASRVFGVSDPSELTTPEMLDKVVVRYLVMQAAEQGPSVTTPGYSALTLLQSSTLTQNLFL